MEEYVILVDENDFPIGSMEKMEAHKKGLLHRAFSVLLFNDSGELLLQKRSGSKYHSPGLWTNTCCSHPRINESVLDAGYRRLQEEMGITASLEKSFDFIYKAQLDKGIVEHEFDHVLIGKFNDKPSINPDEVDSWLYMHPEKILREFEANPENWTEWFKIILPKVYLSQTQRIA